MILENIFQYLASISAISLTIGYLGRKAIDGYLSACIETHKFELQRSINEHSIRFQHLHSERADIIKSMYEKITLLDNILSSALAEFQHVSEPKLTEKVNSIKEIFIEPREFYVPRQISLEEEICLRIGRILGVAKDTFYDITTYEVDPTHREYEINREALQECHKLWKQAREMHRKEFAELKRALEKEFRNILGLSISRP